MKFLRNCFKNKYENFNLAASQFNLKRFIYVKYKGYKILSIKQHSNAFSFDVIFQDKITSVIYELSSSKSKYFLPVASGQVFPVQKAGIKMEPNK